MPIQGSTIVKHVNSCLITVLFSITVNVAATAAPENSHPPEEQITLRAYGVQSDRDVSAFSAYYAERFETFCRRFPHINPVFAGGLSFGGNEYNIMMEVIPLMQIASGVQPDVMGLLVSNCDTYVRQGFLYPLEKFLEKELGIEIENSHLLDLDQYVRRLKESAKYETHVGQRVPVQFWRALRRECPYGRECPYCLQWNAEPAEKHYHVWSMPASLSARNIFYRRDLFREAGLPDRPPETLEELLEFARKLTDPDEKRFGLRLALENQLSLSAAILHSMGAHFAEQSEDGSWRCTLDSEEAVEACYFISRLFYEPYTNPKGKRLTSVVFPGNTSGSVDSPP